MELKGEQEPVDRELATHLVLFQQPLRLSSDFLEPDSPQMGSVTSASCLLSGALGEAGKPSGVRFLLAPWACWTPTA